MCRSPKDCGTTLPGLLRGTTLRASPYHCARIASEHHSPCTGAALLRPSLPSIKLYRPPVFSSSSPNHAPRNPKTSDAVVFTSLPHYVFPSAFSLHLFNLTAEVCSNEPTVLHPFSVFSNLCDTSYPHPRTGQTQNLTFRPAA